MSLLVMLLIKAKVYKYSLSSVVEQFHPPTKIRDCEQCDQIG